MKLHKPSFAVVLLYMSPALGAETVTLAPAALKAVSIAGDAGAPTFAAQNVAATYEVRARDFASGAVRNNLVYLRFDVSSLQNTEIQSAAIKFTRTAGDTLTTTRFSLYGLQDLPGNLNQSWTPSTFAYGAEFAPAMFFDFVASSGACPVDLARVADFSEEETVSGNLATLTSAQFVSFLQARADNGGQATVMLGMPSQGAGNDKKMTFAFPGHVDPTAAVSLVVSYSEAALPSPPANVGLGSITFSTTPSVTIGWDHVEGELAYNVYRRAEGETTATLVETTTALGYIDPNVTLFGTYYYSVDVVTENGQSVPSSELEVRVIDSSLGVPSAPAQLRKASASPTTIAVEWDAVPGAIYYEFYRSTEPDGVFALLQTSQTNSATDVDDLKGFRSYYYRVKAISAGGISRFSSTLTVDPRFVQGGPRPARPRDLDAPSSTAYAINLTWDASANANAYYVYRSTQEDTGFTFVGISETNNWTDSFAVYPNNKYYYTVYAVGSRGFSQPSEVLEVEPALTNYRQVENLSRAPVAVPTAEGVFVSWRLLGTDRQDTGFYVYRDGRRINHQPISGATNFVDPRGTASSKYEVRTGLGLFELLGKEKARTLPNGYLNVPIQAPPGGVTPAGQAYTYTANDASVADLNGDGVYEIILKWDPTNSQDNSLEGYTGNAFVDAYTLEGALLWRVDLGRNIRAGAHYTQFAVYDFDGDGRAEMICKTADGTVDGQGVVIGNAAADYRNSAGRVLAGPEFLTLFDGETGGALDTIDYVPVRGNVTDWGDSAGNRVDRFNAGVAYLDGVRPSAYFARGYYRGQSGMGPGITAVAAFDVADERLVTRWVFDTRASGSEYIGQGNHQVTAGDMDGDGNDEIALGSLVLDDDGTVLYSTNLGHGDAMHVGDFDPTRAGLELFSVKEETTRPFQSVFTDAATGSILWAVFNGADTGRGLTADIDPNYAGNEAWGAANTSVWSAKGAVIGQRRPSINFAIWWDGDPMRELLDDVSVRKWDWANQSEVVLLNAVGAASNNGTKATPALQADLLGDWREEVVLRSADNTELRIYTTSVETAHRIPTLMHDPQYRVAIAAQNSGYNQPPHPSFFIGNNMPAVAMPRVFVEPAPEFLGVKKSDGSYIGAVVVVLDVNQGEPLRNEYRTDNDRWRTYHGPFVVAGRGHHDVAFRTFDGENNLLTQAGRSVTIGW